MSDDATLRDTVVTDPAPAATVDTGAADTTTKTDATATVQATADADAKELGELLLASGFTKSNVNDLIQAPRALESIRYLVRENPQEFLNTLERTDPDAASRFQEKISDIFLERNKHLLEPKGTNGTAKTGDSDLMRQVQQLQEKVNQSETREQQRAQSTALAAAKARYDGRVDDLFGIKEIKELGLTKTEQRALRSHLDRELSSDPAVVQRIANGNFVDVPKAFKGIIDTLAAEKKSAAEEAKAQREGTSKNAFSEFPGGPEPWMKDVPAGAADSWDATEEALAKAFERMLAR